jgi:hypothetical protein
MGYAVPQAVQLIVMDIIVVDAVAAAGGEKDRHVAPA